MPDEPNPQIEEKDPGLIRDHFSVLVVFLAFALLLGVYVLELHWTGNDHVTGWLEGQMNQLIGALLMGLTTAGIAMARRAK